MSATGGPLNTKQSSAFRKLLSVMFAEKLTEEDLEEVIKAGFVEITDTAVKVTSKGLDEKNI